MNLRTRYFIPLSLLLAAPASANLTVHPMRSAVGPEKGTQIRVYSQSTRAQYVQVAMRRIVNPAATDEREVELDPSEAAIAITPGKFALSGGGNRLIRVIPLQPVQEEQAYRVYFEGVRGPDDRPMETAVDGARANVGVSLVWGALVNVVPTDGVVNLDLRDGTLHNTGTLRVGLTSVADCNASGACTAHELRRSLYPGTTVDLPFQPTPGHTLQLRYRLTQGGYREHVHSISL